MDRSADSCTVPCHSGQQKASLYNLCSLATKHAQGGTEPNDDAYLQLWLKFAREQWYASGALFFASASLPVMCKEPVAQAKISVLGTITLTNPLLWST